ncbi:MAG: SCO family protein [Gammaproteobacteria bacterium]|nr:SCO family protein [Gammaproteobacteria bacterium]
MHPLLMIMLLATAMAAATASARPLKPNDADSLEAFDYKAALAASQGAIGRRLSDHMLTDAAGRRVTLAGFRGKPLVMSLVFTSCSTICPTTTRHLARVVEKARDTVGEGNFNVALVGFDSRFDTPEMMARFARKQGIADKGWHLLSADEDTIAALTRELGFYFAPSPSGFDHLVQASIIDGDGQVYRQVYGEVFDTPLLVEPLLELVLGRPQVHHSAIDDLINRVRLFCTTYDPVTDSYHFDYSLFVGMFIGGLIMMLTVIFLVREYLHGKGRQPSC